MAPISSGPRTATRLQWLLTTTFALAVTLTTVSPVLATNTYTVGQPTATGRMKLTIVVSKNGVTREVSVTALIRSDYDVFDKQLAILYAGREAMGDTVRMHGYHPGGKIVFEPQNNWNVEAVTVTQDESCEPHAISLGVPLPNQEALCSLAGTASGVDVHGQVGAGFVKLAAGGATATVPTQPGMPSEVVEQMLIGQLNQAGIPARFATNADFAGGYENLPHDARVIWFPVPDTSGIGQETTDSGLSLDFLGVLDGSLQSPSAVIDGNREPGLRLDVWPSLFTDETVAMRFSTQAGAGPVHLDIFDVVGRRLRTLIESSPEAAGVLSWDGRDERNALLSRGVYFVRLSTPQGNLVRRVVCIRR